MNTNFKFNQIINTLLVLLLIIIVLLGLALEAAMPKLTTPPQIMLGTQTFADFKNQQIKLMFDRPMNKESVSQAIRILDTNNNSAKFNINWNYESAIVVPSQELTPNSVYNFVLLSSAQDIYGKKLSQNYELKFTTQPQMFVYLNKSEFGSNNQDKIILQNVSQDVFTELLSSQGILSYKIKQNYLVVLLQDLNLNQQINIYNFSASLANATLALNYTVPAAKITDYDINTNGDVIAILQPSKTVNGYSVPSGDGQIWLINSAKQQQLNAPKEFNNAMNVIWLADNSGIVFKVATFDPSLGASSEFLVTSFPDFTNQSILGKFPQLNQISNDGSKILFTSLPRSNLFASYPEIYELNNNKDLTQISDGSVNNVIDSVFTNQAGTYLMSKLYKPQERTRGIYNIVEYSKTPQGTDNFKIIVQDETQSLELPRLSSNNLYLTAEVYSLENLLNFRGLRSYGFQTKPYTADLILVNYKTGEIMQRFSNSIEATWLN